MAQGEFEAVPSLVEDVPVRAALLLMGRRPDRVRVPAPARAGASKTVARSAPNSTPQNTIVHGSGDVPLLTTVRTGFGLHITKTLTLVPLTAPTGIGAEAGEGRYGTEWPMWPAPYTNSIKSLCSVR